MTDTGTITGAEQLHTLAERYGVPYLDVALIAANSEGARPLLGYPRARMRLRPNGSTEVWQIILPFDNSRSPFEVADDALLLAGVPVAEVVALENDDVVLLLADRGVPYTMLAKVLRTSAMAGYPHFRFAVMRK